MDNIIDKNRLIMTINEAYGILDRQLQDDGLDWLDRRLVLARRDALSALARLADDGAFDFGDGQPEPVVDKEDDDVVMMGRSDARV